eukprot:COSAG02_NODE_661_length_18757_cov_4.427699_7_plen_118_part_00
MGCGEGAAVADAVCRPWNGAALGLRRCDATPAVRGSPTAVGGLPDRRRWAAAGGWATDAPPASGLVWRGRCSPLLGRTASRGDRICVVDERGGGTVGMSLPLGAWRGGGEGMGGGVT